MDIRSQLVQLAQAGDSQAARSLIEQNQASVYRLALSLLDDPAEAAHAAHEADLALLDNLASYPGPTAHTAWLYRLTFQVCWRMLRAQRTRRMLRMFVELPWLPASLRKRIQRLTPLPAAAGLPEPDPLFQAVARLDEVLRLPLVLRYAHDLRPHEAALVLNWRDRSVQARLSQARRRLLDEWGETAPVPLEEGPQGEGIRHERAESLLEAAADYAITDADAVLLKNHLKDCARCRESSHRLSALEDGLRAAFHARWDGQPLPAPEGGIASLVMDRRRQQTAHRHSFSLSGALVITLLVVGLITLLPAMLPAETLPPLPTRTRASSTPGGDPPPLATATTPVLATDLPPISRQDLLAGIYPGKIAFMTFSGLSDHLFTFEPKYGIFQKITRGSTENSYPAWSPNGRQIAYLVISENQGANQIYVANSDGSNSRPVTREGSPTPSDPGSTADNSDQVKYPHHGPPHWSRDGRYLVSAVWASNSDHFLAVIPLFDQQIITLRVTGLNQELVSWSPDGSAIAYLSDSDQVLWLWQPNLPLREGENPRRLSTGSWEMVFGLTWSPDSTQVAVLGGQLETDVIQVDLQILDRMGSEIQSIPVSKGVVARSPLRSSQLSWSPDGQYLAMIPVFTDNDLAHGRIQLFRIGMKSTMPLLANAPTEVSGLSWSPDGRWLAYSVGHEIWAASLEAFENQQYHLVRLTTSAGYELNWQKVN